MTRLACKLGLIAAVALGTLAFATTPAHAQVLPWRRANYVYYYPAPVYSSYYTPAYTSSYYTPYSYSSSYYTPGYTYSSSYYTPGYTYSSSYYAPAATYSSSYYTPGYTYPTYPSYSYTPYYYRWR